VKIRLISVYPRPISFLMNNDCKSECANLYYNTPPDTPAVRHNRAESAEERFIVLHLLLSHCSLGLGPRSFSHGFCLTFWPLRGAIVVSRPT